MPPVLPEGPGRSLQRTSGCGIGRSLGSRFGRSKSFGPNTPSRLCRRAGSLLRSFSKSGLRRLIAELQEVKTHLQSEGERVEQEMVTKLTQMASFTAKIIFDAIS
jgi:hypothetical protein